MQTRHTRRSKHDCQCSYIKGYYLLCEIGLPLDECQSMIGQFRLCILAKCRLCQCFNSKATVHCQTVNISSNVFSAPSVSLHDVLFQLPYTVVRNTNKLAFAVFYIALWAFVIETPQNLSNNGAIFSKNIVFLRWLSACCCNSKNTV